MHKTITVKDIAQICGVSLGTVDRALNDRPGINEETKRMILE
nr:helix-turn-helix domain-containing protein [Clostridia bacterium]